MMIPMRSAGGLKASGRKPSRGCRRRAGRCTSRSTTRMPAVSSIRGPPPRTAAAGQSSAATGSSPSGYQAAIRTCANGVDHGHPLAAAHIYEQLLADAAAAEPFEPQLSLLACGQLERGGANCDVGRCGPSARSRNTAGSRSRSPGRHKHCRGLDATDDEVMRVAVNIGHPQSVDTAASIG